MQQTGLTCRRKPRYAHTTDSKHGEPVYANLIKDLSIEAPKQCWVADLTCVRLPEGFVAPFLPAGRLLTSVHWLELVAQNGYHIAAASPGNGLSWASGDCWGDPSRLSEGGSSVASPLSTDCEMLASRSVGPSRGIRPESRTGGKFLSNGAIGGGGPASLPDVRGSTSACADLLGGCLPCQTPSLIFGRCAP